MNLSHPSRRLAAIIAAIVLGTTLTTIAATSQTAHAANTNYQTNCAPYNDVVCFFFWPDADNTGNAGQYGRFALGTAMKQCRGMQQMDNIAGSAYIKLHRTQTRAYRVTMYANANCRGTSRTFGWGIAYAYEYIGKYKFSSFKVTVA
jgi:hypothetical protein